MIKLRIMDSFACRRKKDCLFLENLQYWIAKKNKTKQNKYMFSRLQKAINRNWFLICMTATNYDFKVNILIIRLKFQLIKKTSSSFNLFKLTDISLFKVNNGITRGISEICSKLTIKTTERCHWGCSGVFIDNI